MIFSAIAVCVPIASMVMIECFISGKSGNLGMAVISLLLSSVFNCPEQMLLATLHHAPSIGIVLSVFTSLLFLRRVGA
jgi:hypothetical protein